MATPNVSVLIPCHNHAAYVGEAIHSVLTQDNVDLELLLLDDGSTDGSFEAAEQAALGDTRATLWRQDNQGICATLNELYKKAQGAYLVVLSADSSLLPHALQTNLKILAENPKAQAAVGTVDIVDGFGMPHSNGDALSNLCNTPRDPQQLRRQLLLGNCISTESAMIRRSSLGGHRDLAHVDLNHAYAHDLWLRLAQQGDIVAHPHKLARHRAHGNSMDQANLHKAMVEELCCIDVHAPRIIEQHPDLASAWSAIHAHMGELAFGYGNIERAGQHLASGFKEQGLSNEQSLMFLQCLLAMEMPEAAGELVEALRKTKHEMSLAHQELFDETSAFIANEKPEASSAP